MDNFRYRRTVSPEEALEALSSSERTQVLVGGTDLVPLMKMGISSPDTVIDISDWEDGSGIREDENGLTIGALTPLSQLAAHPSIRRSYGAFADACNLAATPQLRNMGSIAGNLLQQTRCWYYRGPYNCWLKGGETCYARGGENQNHSILCTDQSPCVSAHPSDPAAALLALDARIKWRTANEEKGATLEEMYALPEDSRRAVTIVPRDAILTEIIVPKASAGSKSIYRKAMMRAAYSFALAGVAIKLEMEQARISNACVALSGVCPIPIRMRDVEERLNGQNAEDVDLEALSLLLVEKAGPLSNNGYKVPLLQGLLRETLSALLSQTTS